MNMLITHGPAARTLAHLGWWLLVVSAVVVLVVAVIVVVASVRARGRDGGEPTAAVPGELRWIYIGGLAIPVGILVLSFAFSLGALSRVAAPAKRPAVTVQIIGHRWWWELRYLRGDSMPPVVTANELHVPVGQPVRLELTSDDVIHSYWVPQLNGKMDLNPGQRNVSWIEADTAGVYRGQCTEYCGLQHANMATVVIAQPPAEFAAWLAAQAGDAAAPADSAARAGLAAFEKNACASCHTIRGTPAMGARVGPDLTHFGSRSSLAALTLANTPGNLMGWISNAQALKPGVAMPTMLMSPDELHAVAAYLETLK
jgi:cytochrome c oxidase subunit 2